jgi:hypothetical protein
MTRITSLFSAPLAAALLLTACATATPYQPLAKGTKASGGYSEQRIEENRFRVSFSGNSFTSRERVENYLLFRAAELTVQAGFDGFTMVTRAIDPRTRTTVYHDPWFAGGWGYWGPSWRYAYGGGWHYWDPWGPGPFWGSTIDVDTVTRFEATAEIMMFKGQRSDDPRSFDARQVIGNLERTIEPPA